MSKRFDSSIRHDDGRVSEALRALPSAGFEAQSERAVAEAVRVLAETEAGDVHDVRHPRCGIELTPRGLTALALAESLAAALPLLDELAEDAVKEAYLSPRTMDEDSFWGLWDRNRATDAAMDGR